MIDRVGGEKPRKEGELFKGEEKRFPQIVQKKPGEIAMGWGGMIRSEDEPAGHRRERTVPSPGLAQDQRGEKTPGAPFHRRLDRSAPRQAVWPLVRGK